MLLARRDIAVEESVLRTQNLAVFLSDPIEMANEFAAVTVRVLETGHGVRLRIESARSGRSIDLDPLELETLTGQTHDLFSGCLRRAVRPEGWVDYVAVSAGSALAIVGRCRRTSAWPSPRPSWPTERPIRGCWTARARHHACATPAGRRRGGAGRARRPLTGAAGRGPAVEPPPRRLVALAVCNFYRSAGNLAPHDVMPAFDELSHTNVASRLLGVPGRDGRLDRQPGQRRAHLLDLPAFRGHGGALYVASKFAIGGCRHRPGAGLARVRVNAVAPGGTLGTDLCGPAGLGLDAEYSATGRPGIGAADGGHRWPSPYARRSRGQLRVPGVRRGPRHDRHVPPLRRRHRRQGLADPERVASHDPTRPDDQRPRRWSITAAVTVSASTTSRSATAPGARPVTASSSIGAPTIPCPRRPSDRPGGGVDAPLDQLVAR